jgi:hypothetical protein
MRFVRNKTISKSTKEHKTNNKRQLTGWISAARERRFRPATQLLSIYGLKPPKVCIISAFHTLPPVA